MKILRKTIIVILIACMCFCGYKIAQYYFDAHEQKQKFERLAKQVDDSNEKTLILDDKAILKKYEKLYKENDDFIGWIKIKGTKINYPVMQTAEDYSYYLKRNFNKEYSMYGTLFIGEHCRINPNSDNVIIYGHNMKNGTMFADLIKYKDEDFFERHKNVQFDTLYENGKYQVAYVFVTKLNEPDAFKYYEHVDWENEEQFNIFIKSMEKQKLYDTGTKISMSDRIITLSTCENGSADSRMVVVCRKTG